MSKVYNRVELAFLKEVMAKIGFYPAWVELKINYITLVSYALLIMVSLNRALFLQEGFDKKIHFLLIYLLYVLKSFLGC